MTIWQIPGKTFLLGEYAALQGESALILTTKPCFELDCTKADKHPFHQDSPAGRLLQNRDFCGTWKDPYFSLGGLGASSAEFLACYLALHDTCDVTHLLKTYQEHTTSKTGLKPSGYDVLAQSRRGCVFINKNRQEIQEYTWPFADLAFLLIHTGKKLATHTYLQTNTAPGNTRQLSNLALQGKMAFEQMDADLLIQAVRGTYQELLKNNLVAAHTQTLIARLETHLPILAIKGCGAMGADTVVMLVDSDKLVAVKEYLVGEQQVVLADTGDIYW